MSARTTLRLVTATATAAALTGGLLGLSAGAATAAAKPANPAHDFNGDKIRDYANPGDRGFTVTYGTASGPGKKKAFITQDSPGIPGTAGTTEDEYGDAFGSQLAAGDFNNDGYGDLALGDRTETIDKLKHQGGVTIVWGGAKGLDAKATRLPHKNPSSGQGFGRTLVAGDFTGDGKTDLAVADYDTVHIYHGGFSSKTGGAKKITKHTTDWNPVLEPVNLIAGKVDKDKATDLYVLGQGLDKNGRGTSAAWFLRGGTTVKSGKFTTYNKTSVNYRADGVIADFDKDGYGDLALNDFPYEKNTGSVVVLRGGKSGPTGSSYRITQATAGVATAATKGDAFGYALAAGDTDRDGYPDLAVSAEERVRGLQSSGGFHILRGGKKGLTGAGSQWFTRDTAGIPGEPSELGGFGARLAFLDADADGAPELVASDLNGSYDGDSGLLLRTGKSGVTTTGLREIPVGADFVN